MLLAITSPISSIASAPSSIIPDPIAPSTASSITHGRVPRSNPTVLTPTSPPETTGACLATGAAYGFTTPPTRTDPNPGISTPKGCHSAIPSTHPASAAVNCPAPTIAVICSTENSPRLSPWRDT